MPPSLRLRGISPPISGRVWDLPWAAAVARVGRHPQADLQLDDTSVSRRHAQLRAAADGLGWVVCDHGSTNGTYLNGTRVAKGEHPVRSRDVVQFGKLALLVELVEAADDPPSGGGVPSGGPDGSGRRPPRAAGMLC